MSLATAELPTDPAALRAFALACQDELRAAELAVQSKPLEIEKLKFQIAQLRRRQFGRSSERISRQIEQRELQLEDLETDAAADAAQADGETADPAAPLGERAKPTRKPLPDHLSLYRQSAIYAREGIAPDRSTLGDWVGQAAWLLDPVVVDIRRHVLAAAN